MPEPERKEQIKTSSTSLRFIACPSLFYEHGRIDRYVPAGPTVSEHLGAIGWNPDRLHARDLIDGVVMLVNQLFRVNLLGLSPSRRR